MSENRIFLSSPHMSGKELNYVNEAFESNWITPVGPFLERFEKDICTYNKVGYASVLSSGTAAIHLALILLGVQKGDDVFCSSFTFAASANPITYVGANPVFVDSEEVTWNIDPDLLEEELLKRSKNNRLPKAIIVVHLYGMPSQMKEIMTISEKYGIPVIEDAAEALGSNIEGQMMSSFGQIGVFSFNGNKIITTSGGGALVSDNEELVKKASFLATQARDAAPHYQHSNIGYNYRLSNICAAIGVGQMEVLDERITARRDVYSMYESNLNNRSEITFLNEPAGYFSNRWLSCILFETNELREKVRLELAEKNIESRPLWKPMHMQPIFKEFEFIGDGVCERLFSHGLCLPSGSNLIQSDIEKVVSCISSTLDR